MAPTDPDSLQTFLLLTIILLIVKAVLTIYIVKGLYDKKKETGEFKVGFIFGMLIFFICLLISRLFFIYFDFYLTALDVDVYHLPENVWSWKLGMFISTFGLAVLVFIIDWKGLKFKLKGVLAYIIIIGAIIILIYPVTNPSDFQTMSSISMISSSGTLIIPIIFIYLGVKIPGLRKPAFLLVIGFIVYAAGALVVNDAILIMFREAFGEGIHTFIFFLNILFKIAGLIVISISIVNFKI